MSYILCLFAFSPPSFSLTLSLLFSLSICVTGRNKILRIRLKTPLHSRSSQGHRHLVHPMSKKLKKLRQQQQQVETAVKICGSNHLLMKCGSEDKEFYPFEKKKKQKRKSLYPPLSLSFSLTSTLSLYIYKLHERKTTRRKNTNKQNR